jgi:hypothetical protein
VVGGRLRQRMSAGWLLIDVEHWLFRLLVMRPGWYRPVQGEWERRCWVIGGLGTLLGPEETDPSAPELAAVCWG